MGNIILLKDKEGNRYEFDDTDIIGQGGMGIVYLGRRIDTNGVEIKVAIKEIKAKTKEIIERAQRESQIRLNNENLVRMYAFLESEVNNGDFVYKNYYVVSEYLEGVLLDDIIRGKIENKDGDVFPAIRYFYDSYLHDREKLATEIIKAVLSGVMALHDKGYLHRDIDPTNIMITSDGGIKLIDFGIAKKLSDVSSMERKLTTPGAFVGKPEYSAPELIRGDIEHQGYYTDVYAIGILYYQLLTGHIPFEGSRYDIIKQHLNSKVPLKEITSSVIKRIIKKATEKDYNKRYATVALFRAAIDRPEESKSILKPVVYMGIVAIVLFAVFMLFQYKDQFKITSPNDNEDPYIVQNTDSLKYEEAMRLISFNDRDSIDVGIKEMISLAGQGNQDAMFELAKTYAWIPNDEESNRRKLVLGIEMDSQTRQPVSIEVNRNAFEWLDKAIQASDSCDYRCLYWQSFYFLNGLYVNTDMNMAKQLLKKAHDGAVNAGDSDFLDKVNKTIMQLN